jgi:RNA recognition motif-containing protein
MREKGGERREERGWGRENTNKKFKNNPEFNDNTTTFFITNFPDEVKAADLLETFARYWRVGEVFIPVRRDRFDKRFGFARFAEVKDAELLLKKIKVHGLALTRSEPMSHVLNGVTTAPGRQHRGLTLNHKGRGVWMLEAQGRGSLTNMY